MGRSGIEHLGLGRGRRELTESASQGATLEEGWAAGGCEHGRVDGLAQLTEQPLDAGGGDDQSAKLHARAAAVARVTVDSRRSLEQGCPPPVVTAVGRGLWALRVRVRV